MGFHSKSFVVLVAPNECEDGHCCKKGEKSANPFFLAWMREDFFYYHRSCDRLTAVVKFTAFKLSLDDLYSAHFLQKSVL